MTSSLSRQLASLKSDSGIGAVADLSQGVTTRQSLLTGESGSSLALSAAQVQLLARQGLTNLSKNVRILKAFEDVVFPPSDQLGDQGSSMQMEVEEDDIVDAVDKSHLTLENLLVILSPHLLGKDAQFILQFLMNQHQVRYAKEYALFVFSRDGPKQNATSLLTPVSNLVFYALSSGTLGTTALHGSFNNHLNERI